MASEKFQCSVITPEAPVFDGQVDMAVLPAHDGQIGILHDRAPLLCELGAGRLRLQTDAGPENWFIDGGFAQMLDNQLTILATEALRPEAIDRSAAEAMLAEAHKIKPTDEVSARRKADLEASARARLRMAR